MMMSAALDRILSPPQAAQQSFASPHAAPTAHRPHVTATGATAGAADPATSNSSSRRDALLLAISSVAAGPLPWRPHAAAAAPDQRLLKAFQAALAAPDYDAAERAWSAAIEIAPDNGPAYSNRGTVRLQNGGWQAAREDFLRALDIESAAGSDASAALLNNLGNAEGALGDWTSAQARFRQAAQDSEMAGIATANLALAQFETGSTQEAINTTRQLLRRDAKFLDMRCALAAFLWASGERSQAENEWETLQNAQDGIGGAIYSKATAVQRVRNRWPPRATAALRAFLSMASEGAAEGYDGEQKSFKFE